MILADCLSMEQECAEASEINGGALLREAKVIFKERQAHKPDGNEE